MKRVVGWSSVNYTSKKTGNPVKGANIYCTIDDSKQYNGLGVQSIYMSDNILNRTLDSLEIVNLNDLIGLEFQEVLYNQFGTAIGFLI